MYPNLPTDSLYKFMALGGYSLAAFFFWLFYTRVDAHTIRTAAFAIELAERKVRTHALKDEVAHVRSLTEPEQRAALPGLIVASTEAEANFEASSAQLRAIQANDREIKRLGYAAMIFAVIGIAIGNAGFGLWYTRVQRYQDIILRATADSVVAAHVAPAQKR